MAELVKSRNKKLSEREHIILRSGMYLGSKTLKTQSEYIIKDGKFSYEEVQYVPGLIKIFNELIDNSLDEHQRTGGKYATKIDINVTSTEFSVSDNGRGIPVLETTDDLGNVILEPELVWTHARAGSNFDDDNKTEDEQATIGTNGVGSMIASVFSTEFIGITDDGQNRCKVHCKNNNEVVKSTLLKSTANGTSVTIKPDLEKFSLSEIDKAHIDVLEQRVYMLSVSYPNVSFKFNGTKIKLTPKQFVSMFGESVEITDGNYTIAFLPNAEDDFRHYSILNGLNLRKGGTHVNHIIINVVNKLRDKLVKKHKEIKPGDIRNKLFFVSIFNKFPNAQWDGQTKEDLANPTKDISDYLGDIDFDKIALKLFKTPAIVDPITEIYRIKEEFKKRQELKALDKKPKQKPKSEKFMPPIGEWTNVYLAEGDCLHEDTDILLSDNSKIKIKNIRVNDTIISGDGSLQRVKSKTKIMRETISFKTKTSEIKCSAKHRFYVYNKKKNAFEFELAGIIKNDIDNYKFLKSKITKSPKYYDVLSNNENFIELDLDDVGIGISYTDNDYFIVLRNDYIRVHASKIIPGDMIVAFTDM